MNGQPYNYSGSNSGNGTPTPSSISYPASLSSQSSRDASPARLPPNMNHNTPEKSPLVSSNNAGLVYRNQETVQPSMYGHGFNDGGATSPRQQLGEYTTNPSNDNVMRVAPTAGLPISPLAAPLNSHVLPAQAKPPNAYPDVRNQLPPRYENIMNTAQPDANYMQNAKAPELTTIQPRLQDSYNQGYPNNSFGAPPVKMEQYAHPNMNNDWQMNHNAVKTAVPTESIASPVYANQNASKDFHHPQSPTSYPVNSYQPNSSPYNVIRPPNQLMSPAPGQAKTQEAPISSGPPRTNVLGIIPYNTEPVTAMSQGSIGVVNQKPVTPTLNHSQPTVKSPVYNQSPSHAPLYNAPTAMPAPATQQNLYQNQNRVGVPAMATAQPPRTPVTNQMSMKASYPNQPISRPIEPYNQPQYQNYNYQQQNNAVNHGAYNQQQQGYYPGPDDLANSMAGMSVNAGYNKLWGREAVDLLKSKDILPQPKVEPPRIRLSQEYFDAANCSPEIFRCTLTKIPETKSLLDKSRLPLGVLIHPFKDLNQLSVIQCSVIVRCRSCRTYINPFVYFVDSKRWKCNLCFRVNDLPEEFQYDPLTKTYGDPSRRPEIKSATIEFIAPSEYMVRPPQPAAYVFVIDVSRLGAEAGYLKSFCDCLLSQLEALPGDSRTSVGFITYDSNVHYYSLAETQTQPHQMVIVDIDDMFVPCPDNLLVNLNECLGLVRDLLRELPEKYQESFDTGSALGPALQAAYKLLAATGGRITVFQSCLPNCGPGKLTPREDPSQRSGENVNQAMLNPVTDFYKKLALDCSGQQIAVDVFVLNSQFVDLASLSGVAKFSGGSLHHFPLFSSKNPLHVESLQRSLHRYLCRKIGFESVMRLRCTRGLSIHTFHGNFFVRSTDLLSLPNVNPDAGFGMQVSIDENLTDLQNVCFQAALLYTSSKGERRIRVHTLCLPIASNLSDVLHSADQQCIVGLLAKMAVDRCHQYSLGDAREAFVNVVADMLSSYKITQSNYPSTSLLAPMSLSLLPLYILALLKYVAFRIGQSTRLDDRVFAMCQMKSLPLSQLIQTIYPDLYPVHNITECPQVSIGDDTVPAPPTLHLTAEKIDSNGIYLLDDGTTIMIYVGHNISQRLAISLFAAPSFASINPNMRELPELDNAESKELRNFVNFLQNEKPIAPPLLIIKDDDPLRIVFMEKLIEDKTESGHSYYEFLQRVKLLVK
uniref:Protein transport protein Sec24A n=4 Tax=Lygus hesperus TaxID=30085 RepID=A0A0A9X976_LYGHE